MFGGWAVRCRGKRVPLWAYAEASLPPAAPVTGWYRIKFIQGMGRGVERVVETEKGSGGGAWGRVSGERRGRKWGEREKEEE